MRLEQRKLPTMAHVSFLEFLLSKELFMVLDYLTRQLPETKIAEFANSVNLDEVAHIMSHLI